MKDFFKRVFLRLFEFLTKVIAKFKAPWTNMILDGAQVGIIMNRARPGDFIVVRACGYLSSMFLGDFSHVLYVHSKNTILDSSHLGVSLRHILFVLLGYSRAAIVRPKFTKTEFQKMHDRAEYLIQLDAKNPIEYNYCVLENNKIVKGPEVLTCSQLCRDLTNSARKDFMELRPRLGFMSIAPNDFYDAKSKFDLIHEVKR